MDRYDAIVLGAGGVGSAAMHHLARRGARVLGIDRFHPPHARGSTHGHTRVIRQAYFEHPDYVPLLLESYRLWRELEATTGTQLLHEVGLLELGPADGVVVPCVLRAAEEHHLEVERLTTVEIESRWPGLRVPAGLAGVFERAGGYLLVEDCVRAHLQTAAGTGAELLPNTAVQDWWDVGGRIRVRAGDREFEAEHLIVTAGAWASRLLAMLNVRLQVLRKSLFWFATELPTYRNDSGFPVFLFELPNGIFYGFPQLDDRGVKVAEHSGGALVMDPLTVNREMDVAERDRLVEVLREYLPAVSPRVTDHAVCLYTMSPDEHFLVDRHPQQAKVVFAAGLSGHGFKFAPVLGRALAELALDGGTELPVEFLSVKRFL